MKEAGALILHKKLGFQFTPDDFREEDVVEAMFLAMLSVYLPEGRSIDSAETCVGENTPRP